jgi:hypothetical protein
VVPEKLWDLHQQTMFDHTEKEAARFRLRRPDADILDHQTFIEEE